MFKNINRVVRTLVTVDFFYNGAFGSFAPVFAIFVIGEIEGGSAIVAGLATTTYWVVKSLVQLPIARFLDVTDGERDDFWALFCGYFAAALVPFGYLFATMPWHVYVLQGFLGFSMAFAVPGWYAIFTRHVDKWRIGFEWSLQSVFAVGIAYAIAAAVGGFVVEEFGFRALFVGAGVVGIFAALLLLPLRHHVFPNDQGENAIPEQAKHR
ncbi:MAG: MFS transporter [Candidatus Jorgensenbacteria bacterium]|nr:MFS transporter [Candidatus Jorgensenbacteria bacterium]